MRAPSLLLGLAAAMLLVLPVVAGSAAQQTYYFLVFNQPVAGQEEAYNRWYDEQHAPDVVSVPGFVSARRYVYNAAVQLREVPLKRPRYLVVYTIVTDDLPAVITEVKRRLKSGETRVSNTLDPKVSEMYIYRAFRPPVRGAGGDATDARAGAKQSYLQVVFGDAVAGQDDAFNTWYDNDHAPNMVAAPGFVDAQRAIVSDVQMEPLQQPSRYLALFRIETSDLAAVLRYKGKGTEPAAAFDRQKTFGYTYRAVGPLIDGDSVRAARAAARR